MNRDELLHGLAMLLATSVRRADAPRSPGEAYALGQLTRERDYPRTDDGAPSRDVRELQAWLTRRLTGRQYPDNAVCLTFDGAVVAEHGVATGLEPDGAVFSYVVRTAADAASVHAAWREWVDARSRLSTRGTRPKKADVDEVAGLRDRFISLRDELAWDGSTPPQDYAPPPYVEPDEREEAWVTPGDALVDRQKLRSALEMAREAGLDSWPLT